MGNDQPALRALFAYESVLSEPEIRLEHVIVVLIWQKIQKKHDKWQNSHGARLQKQLQTALIDNLHVRLIFYLIPVKNLLKSEKLQNLV